MKKEFKIYDYILIGAFIVFLLLISNAKITGEDDLFWYLSTGRYIVEKGIFPATDIFGFTTFGQPWIPFEWLWDIITFYVFGIDEFISLSFFGVILIFLIYFLLYNNIRKAGITNSFSILILFITTLGILGRLTVKPHLVTYIMLLLVLSIIYSYRYVNRKNYRILFFLPLIFLFWINLHMGVMIGFLLLGGYIVCEIITTVFHTENKNIRPLTWKEILRLIIIGIISLLVTLINPHGLETYRYAFHIVSMKQLDIIYEWISPFSKGYLTSFHNIIYYIFIAGLIPILLYSLRKKDVLPFFISIAFFIHSSRAVRLTVDYILISSLFLSISLFYFIEKSKSKKLYEFITESNKFKIFLSVLILITTLTIPSNYFYRLTEYKRIFGTGLDNNSFPVEMFSFMKKNNITDIGQKPFNTYENGGYFIWNFPEKKNFIGSRGINDEVWNDYVHIINTQPGFEKLMDNHSIDHIIWNIPDINYAESPEFLNFGLLSSLNNDTTGWKLIYWDDFSLLYIKNEPKFSELIRNFSYKYFTPYNYYYNREQLLKEINEYPEETKKEFLRITQNVKNSRIASAMKMSFGKKFNL